APGARVVISHHALDQGRLAGAVLAEHGVDGTRRDPQRYAVERAERAEVLDEVGDLELRRRARRGHRAAPHAPSASRAASAASRSAELVTAPNTPFCIVTILTAASWLPRSVAPQQSARSRHSKPRSLASRMVVCTHTSVVMPVSTRLAMPRVRRISSR